jgi:ribA/ribD-fused uncharacterized protein
MATTAASLRATWRERTEPEDVLGFYSEKREHGFCSNFFISRPPFEFKLSPMLQRTVALTPTNGFISPVLCDCAEKAIMLSKAALMGDSATYQKIVRSSSPAEAKRLGRSVRPFDHSRWDSAVCRVATDVLWMKFSPDPALRRALLGTGDRVLAETTRYDQIWGIGLDMGEEAVRTPAKWRGSNILGWALMEVRAKLRAQTVSTPRLIGRAAVPSTRAGARQRSPHQRITKYPATPQQRGPEAAGTSAHSSQEEFLDDDTLLAIDIDSIVASASAQRPHLVKAAVLPAQQQTPTSRDEFQFLDDSTLLAVDLEGLVAAATPSIDLQQQNKTPDHAAKTAANTARLQPPTTLCRSATLKHARSDASSDDDDDADADDPDGSIARLFAAERSSTVAAIAARVDAKHAQKRVRPVEEDGDEDL